MDDTRPILAQSQTALIPGIEVLELIGRGGMSCVYKARHLVLDQIVALKIISAQELGEGGRERFLREGKHTAALDHPQIVKVLSSGVASDGNPYLVMEYLRGIPLSEILKHSHQFTPAQLLAISNDVLRALSYAHDHGLIHRDIKPGNIIISGLNPNTKTDSGEIAKISAKLVDFGISRSISDEETLKLTKSGYLLGTPAYMSPEQCSDLELTPQSDLYSYACVLFECVTGRKLFEGDTSLDVMYQHLRVKPPLDKLQKIAGKDLADLLNKVLSKDPSERPGSASQLNVQLKEAIFKMPKANIAGTESATKKQNISLKKVVLSALIGLMAGGLFGGILSWNLKPVNSGKKTQARIPAQGRINVDSSELNSMLDTAEKHLKLAQDYLDKDIDRAKFECDNSERIASRAIRLQWQIGYRANLVIARDYRMLAEIARRKMIESQKLYMEALKHYDQIAAKKQIKVYQDQFGIRNNHLGSSVSHYEVAGNYLVRIDPDYKSEDMFEGLSENAFIHKEIAGNKHAVEYLNSVVKLIKVQNPNSPNLEKFKNLIKSFELEARKSKK